MPDYSATAPARLATRLAFFAAGFAMACWAPLIPFAKENIGADEATLGLLLLCIGIGSLIAMPLTGWLAARSGAKPMILIGGFGLALALPFLIAAQSLWLLATLLLVIGAFLGTIDVSMNIHAVEVENTEDRPLMSGFHAQFSIGGFAGATLITYLLSRGIEAQVAILVGGAITFAVMAFAAPRFLKAKGGDPVPFALPKGIVVLLAALTAITFLVEGAILDWSALLLVERQITPVEQAGTAYILFSIAMVIGRLTGDKVVAALGGFRILLLGGLLTAVGLAMTVLMPWPIASLAGFLLVGIGAANIVPVLFSAAGKQKIMPAGMAIASVTTTGYAGILMGPAIIGFAAQIITLPLAFGLLALMMLAIPLSARVATKR